MPARCIVAGCSNTSSDGFTLHRFPLDPKNRRIWTEIVQHSRPKWLGPTQHSTVCSAHFEPTCYDGGLYSQFDISFKQRLLKNAIPTIFPGSRKDDKLPGKPKEAFQAKTRILNEALGQTSIQYASGEETNNAEKQAVPVSIIRVCDEENHYEETGHPLPSAHLDNVENNLLAWQNAHKPPSVNLEDVGDSSEKGNQCSAIKNQQPGPNEESLTHTNPLCIAKQMNLSEAGALCPAPALDQRQQQGRTNFFLVPTPTNLIYVPQPSSGQGALALHSAIATQDNLKDSKIKTGNQCQVLNEQQQKDASQELRSYLERSRSELIRQELDVDNNDDNHKFNAVDNDDALTADFADQEGQTQIIVDMDRIDQTSEDRDDSEISEADEDEAAEEDDNLEMEDHSSDNDYVPDVRVHVSKRKKKQRGRTLRPRRACKKPSINDEQTQPPEEDMDAEKHSSESSEEDKEDNKLSSDEEDDLLSSGEDSDEIVLREKQAEKRRQCKNKNKNRPITYVRLEVRFSRLPKMYECKTCQERFQEAEEMRRHHTESHSKEQTDMPDADQQELHAVNVPPLYLVIDMAEIATELRQCQKCKEYVKNMQKHYRSHLERKFQCDTCGKSFLSRWAVNYHRLSHESKENGKQYKCTECDKSYPIKHSLDIHYKTIHNGEQLFICEHCGKQFNRSKSFRNHKFIHLKEKPFKCSQCGRGFSQKSNMTLHMRTHTGARPYQCNICMEAFNHNVSLKTHQKKVHGIDWWKDKNKAVVS